MPCGWASGTGCVVGTAVAESLIAGLGESRAEGLIGQAWQLTVGRVPGPPVMPGSASMR